MKVRMKAGVAPAFNLFNGTANDPSKIFSLKKVASELMEQHMLPFADAVHLFHEHREKFLSVVAKHFHPELNTTASSRTEVIRCDLFSQLPLVVVPWRAPGQAGERPLLLLPDIPTLDDYDLEQQLWPVLELRRLQEARAATGAPLSTEDYALLKQSMPSEMSAVTDALIFKYGGASAVEALGIGMGRAATADARLDALVSKTLPEAMREAHAAAHALLAKRGGLADDDISSALRTATTRQLRAIVEKQHLLQDKRFATHEALLKKAPDLLDLLRACAAAGSNAVYKERGETPIDEILLETMRGSGGQQLRMQTILNSVLADRNLSVSIGSINMLLKQANIKALAVKHTLNPPKVGKHYCCAEIRTHRQIAHLFSAYCVRLSIDQKANLKSNSDHNTAEGGNRKKFQISSERTCVHQGSNLRSHVCLLRSRLRVAPRCAAASRTRTARAATTSPSTASSRCCCCPCARSRAPRLASRTST